MSDLITEINRLADYKTRLYNRLVAQGDTTIQANDSMETYTSHYESLYKRQTSTLNITENGTYTATTDPISGYANINVNVPTGGGNHKKYEILDRVYADDTGDAIGTVSGIFVDNNGTEYAVVVLDCPYRLASAKWLSSNSSVTNLPQYSSTNSAAFGFGAETATFNCDKILAMTSYTSEAVNHCRSKSFTIGGVTYYGQLPNIFELLQIFSQKYKLDTLDSTASSAASNVRLSTWSFSSYCVWSSSQYASSNAWYVGNNGGASGNNKTNASGVVPVLEIPNAVA